MKSGLEGKSTILIASVKELFFLQKQYITNYLILHNLSGAYYGTNKIGLIAKMTHKTMHAKFFPYL